MDVVTLQSAKTYARSIAAPRLSNRVIFLGDSITQGSADSANNFYTNDWTFLASILSGGRIQIATNAGIAGETSQQIAARLPALLAAYPDAAVSIMAGRNDNTTSLTATAPYLEQMIRAAATAGRQIILCTIPPTTDTDSGAQTTNDTKTALINAIVRKLAVQYRLPVVDFHRILTDPLTGKYKTGYSTDGIHPWGSNGTTSLLAMAQAYSSAVAPLLPPVGGLVADHPSDPQNLIGNAMMLTNSSGVPTGWYQYSGTGFTHSCQVDSDFAGQSARIVRTTTDQHVMQKDISAGSGTFQPGDVVEFAIRVRVTGSDSAARWDIACNITGGTGTPGRVVLFRRYGDMPVGDVYSGRVTVRSGATALAAQVVTQGGAMQIDVGQVMLRNLTKLGLA